VNCRSPDRQGAGDRCKNAAPPVGFSFRQLETAAATRTTFNCTPIKGCVLEKLVNALILDEKEGWPFKLITQRNL